MLQPKPIPMMTSAEWQPRRVLVTGYYDGPTEGVIDFGDAIGVYCFQAMAFDFEREMRVLKLTRVSSERLESLVRTLSSSVGPPQWPFWVPIWNFSDESAKAAAEGELDATCAAGETELAALTDDTIEKCYALRNIDEQSVPVVNDWLSLFREDLS
jgi:hypothetical protein